MKRPITRTVRGFVMLAHPSGPPVWGSFRPKEVDARAFYERMNPAVPGHPRPGVMAEVEIIIREETVQRDFGPLWAEVDRTERSGDPAQKGSANSLRLSSGQIWGKKPIPRRQIELLH